MAKAFAIRATLGSLLLAAAVGSAASAQTVSVKVVTAATSDYTATVILTGDIQATTQADVSFRTNGKITERHVEIGDHVSGDEVLARLDPQEQTANVQNAVAVANSAQATLQQAQLDFARQETLLKSGYTTRATFDQSQATLRTAQASLDSAKASLETAREQLTYTELKAGFSGIVVARSVEVGQVVQAGQAAFTVARDGARDAVFYVYEALLVSPPRSDLVTIKLLSNPAIETTGHVREISPTVDSASGTVKVKVGLNTTPAEFALGATVIGSGQFNSERVVSLPWGALFRWNDKPAVYVLDPKTETVSLRTVTIARYTDGNVLLSKGVAEGERIVTAGTPFLRPGEKVAVMEATR